MHRAPPRYRGRQETSRHAYRDFPWLDRRSSSTSASLLSALPCVGCGWCCLSDPCTESHILYGYQKRCPDLYWDGEAERYQCRLAGDPINGERFRFLLGVGEGCCAPRNTWRNHVTNRD
ncbi:MAG: hypothetical protein AB9872_02990 [Solidesulfovibrio sp.]